MSSILAGRIKSVTYFLTGRSAFEAIVRQPWNGGGLNLNGSEYVQKSYAMRRLWIDECDV